MPKVIPLRELKNASQISKMCHENDGPIIVTKNGRSDMVIISSDRYDDLSNNTEKRENYTLLQQYHKTRDSKPLYSISEIKQVLSPIFKKHKVKKAILFGSYVKGTADSRSDIDIVVDTDLKGLAFYGLLGEAADSLRFPLDLIERRQIEKGSDFEKEIQKTGVTIYGQQRYQSP